MRKLIPIALALVVALTTSYAMRTPRLRAWMTEALGNALYPSRPVTIPAGSVLTVRLRDALDGESRADMPFQAALDEPILADGSIVIPAGAEITGHVVTRMPGGAGAELLLSYDSVALGLQRAPLGAVARYPIRALRFAAHARDDRIAALPGRHDEAGMIMTVAEESPAGEPPPHDGGPGLARGTRLQFRLERGLIVRVPPL